MVWYVAIVAIANLGLGYALASYLSGARRGSYASAAPSDDSDEYSSEYADA